MSDRLQEIRYTNIVKSLETELRACRRSQFAWRSLAAGCALLTVFVIVLTLQALATVTEEMGCEKHCGAVLQAAASCVARETETSRGNPWICIMRLP